jgi:hypothetical protein
MSNLVPWSKAFGFSLKLKLLGVTFCYFLKFEGIRYCKRLAQLGSCVNVEKKEKKAESYFFWRFIKLNVTLIDFCLLFVYKMIGTRQWYYE